MASCGRYGTVVRVVDGHEVRGRSVRPDAYAFYLRGALLEAQGQDASARAAYEQVVALDPDSVQAWTRVAALVCRTEPAAAARVFEAAAAVDDTYEPLWRERARCYLVQGDPRAACESAQRAVELDPDLIEPTLLLGEACSEAGRGSQARRWMWSYVQRRPQAAPVWSALLELAAKEGDQPLVARAQRALEQLRPPTAPLERTQATRQIDAALVDHDLEGAQDLAIESGVPLAFVALRAAASGRPQEAAVLARLVLEADPDNADAWIAGAVAADLSGNSEAFAEVVGRLGREPLEPEPLAARLLAELLSRRVNAEAARAWLTAFGPLGEPADDLERRVADHLLEP